jgi:hypothetical protein
MIENYIKIENGHWFQENLTGKMPDYSATYSKERYDTYSTNDSMSKLRYDLICKYVGHFDNICDYGYGNGAFMRYCSQKDKNVYGYDISDYPVPQKTNRLNSLYELYQSSFDVVTFFDSIEHIPKMDLTYDLQALPTKFVCISIPWFHESLGPEWFRTWKHRRENEHLHHFDVSGISKLLKHSNFKLVHLGNEEDEIRKSVDEMPNILTVIAKKI